MILIVPPAVYERFRALVRAEPLLLARGKFERLGRNRNVVVRELESLNALARRCADEADVFGSLVKQFKAGQTAEDADWLIGVGLFTENVKSGSDGPAALRSRTSS